MRVAFYAPLKPLDHPVPSGDRAMGRLLRAAIEAAGCEVEVVSGLRSFLAAPDAVRQDEIARQAEAEAERILAGWAARSADRPTLWFTYHNHYKAPDLIGPVVARAAGLPYVLAEASHAPRRATLWSSWAEAATDASRAADLHLCFTERDRTGLLPLLRPEACAQVLPPFIDTRDWSPPSPRLQDDTCRLVTIAMMRPGDKLQSYRLLAAALARLSDLPWILTIVGDGPARPEVEAAFTAVPRDRVRWRGALDRDAVRQELALADLYAWPGFGEAFGMSYLEAQASGLPVVALATAGVPSVVRDGLTGYLVGEPTAEAYAEALAGLIQCPELRSTLGCAASRFAREERSFGRAVEMLRAALALVRHPQPEHAA